MKEIDWRILIELYEKRSMTKAAESLYMTQSALSKRVHVIEEEWGIEAVKRSSKGVTFTEDGKYPCKKGKHYAGFLKRDWRRILQKIKSQKEHRKNWSSNFLCPNPHARIFSENM